VDEAAKSPRLGVSDITRENAEKVSCGRGSGDGCEAELHPIPAAGAGVGGDAVDFPFWQVLRFCSAGADGGKRGGC